MGYCDSGCEFLTTRHNCKKYKKGLAYSSYSSRSLATSCHERCSECDKDHYIAELESRVKELTAAKERLGKYENTGLTPEEIMDGKLLTGWIPVSERLPTPGEHVLVTFDDGFVATATCYHDWELWVGSGEVVAWMPKPTPYRPEV